MPILASVWSVRMFYTYIHFIDKQYPTRSAVVIVKCGQEITKFNIFNNVYGTLEHCKNISTMFWSSRLHALCMHDTLQISKGCFLFHSKLKCSREAAPSIRIFLQKAYSYFVTLLTFLPLPCNQALLQGQMCRIKETPTSPEML